MNRLTEMVGWFEMCLAVCISVGGSWVVMKQDVVRLETRVEYIEEISRDTIKTNRDLSGAITELTVVLAGLKVEIGYIKEGVNELNN